LPDSSLAGQEHGRTIPLADKGTATEVKIGGFTVDLFLRLAQ